MSGSHQGDVEPATATAHDTGSLGAFVIDDEDGICKFISAILENLGMTADSFASAAPAVAALQNGHPDVVFLDIALNGSDAIDVIRMLAKNRYCGFVQLMSGSRSTLLDDVYRIGAMHGLNMLEPLEKPFRREDVCTVIANLRRHDRAEITISSPRPLQPGLDIALRNSWLELWYQPKFDLRTSALAGADGVIIYRHPKHGVHAIDNLLPRSSAKTRSALTERFLITALRDWDEAGFNVRTTVNGNFGALSTLDLSALDRDHRPKTKTWPGLILGISEHEVIEDVEAAHEIATQLRIYDITLAINNFGAGFSSFERLRELPFSELKLHAGFVAGCAHDERNASICRAAIDLAHRFGAVAVADGLESLSDMQALRAMGCDLGRGPIFGEPIPKSQFLRTHEMGASYIRAPFP